jgi:hypothetical protein
MPTGRRSVMVLAAAAAVPIALAGAGKAAAAGSVLAGARAVAASAGVWGTATSIPGTNRFPQVQGSGWVTSVSCAEPGDCGAGGAYPDSHGYSHAFVANEVNGTWHTAVNIVGAGLAKGYPTSVNSVSCAKPGDCSAGGYYQDSAGNDQAFVANEVNGTWHTAVEVPGTAALNASRNASVNSVSCASPGNCSAGGQYEGAPWDIFGEAFVANEVNGTWHTAIEVPGTAALNANGSASLNSVSCASPGNCTAGGHYGDLHSKQQAFVANEVNGTWHTAIEVPGTAALNQGGAADVASVSCGSAGRCSAGGHYSDVYGQWQAFVANEVNGTWHAAIEVPGTAALNQGDYGSVTSISCTSPGNCSAGGHYSGGSFPRAFVANEVNGTWHTAIAVPGTGTSNSNVYSVSCASAGNCSAGGYSGAGQAFVLNEVNGTWHTLIDVSGIPAASAVDSVSCAAAGECSAGGTYSLPGGYGRVFVVSSS